MDCSKGLQADPKDCLSFIISQSLLKLTSIEFVMLFNHLMFCHPLLLLPSIFPSLGALPSELPLCIRWPKYWSLSISPSNEYLGFYSTFCLSIQGHLDCLFLL